MRKTLSGIMFPSKININIPVTGKAKIEVKKINSVIPKSLINFNGGPHMPHITLIMGTVHSYKDYLQIEKEVKTLSKELNPFKYTVKKIYKPNRTSEYIFADVLTDEIPRIKHLLFSRIGKFIELSTFGGSENTPHITLGYAEDFQEIELTTLSSNLVSLGYASRIAISQAGPKGTCLNLLKYFCLKKMS